VRWRQQQQELELELEQKWRERLWQQLFRQRQRELRPALRRMALLMPQWP
jgi:hypothetical protein